MVSESSSERTVLVTLPSELDEWLDDQSQRRDIDREQLLVQLLTSYRTVTELDEADFLLEDGTLSERIEAELEQRVRTEVESAVESSLSGQVSEATATVQRRLTNRIDSVENEFDDKITDVRERVVQIKKETDQKAPAEHTHEELAEVTEIATQLEEMEADLADLRAEFDEVVPDHEETLDDVDSRLEQLQERMQTIAWVVSDLRDAYESKGGLKTVERIKRAAAKANVEHADCENCGDSVALSLLTDPTCPHCDATVSNIEASSGWFGSPKLLTASQLESGEQS